MPIIDAIAAASDKPKALIEMNAKEAYELALSRGYRGQKIESFNQQFSKEKEAFGKKWGLERWQKNEGTTSVYFYRDTL